MGRADSAVGVSEEVEEEVGEAAGGIGSAQGSRAIPDLNEGLKVELFRRT